MKQEKPEVGPPPRESNVWQAVTLAASRVPDWALVRPEKAPSIRVTTDSGEMAIIVEPKK